MHIFLLPLLTLLSTSSANALQKNTTHNLNVPMSLDESDVKEQAQVQEFTLVCSSGEKVTIPIEYGQYIQLLANKTPDGKEILIADPSIKADTLNAIKAVVKEIHLHNMIYETTDTINFFPAQGKDEEALNLLRAVNYFDIPLLYANLRNYFTQKLVAEREGSEKGYKDLLEQLPEDIQRDITPSTVKKHPIIAKILANPELYKTACFEVPAHALHYLQLQNLSPDGTKLAYLQKTETGLVLHVIDCNPFGNQKTLELPELPRSLSKDILKVHWSPDGSKIMTAGSTESELYIWDATSHTHIATILAQVSDCAPLYDNFFQLQRIKVKHHQWAPSSNQIVMACAVFHTSNFGEGAWDEVRIYDVATKRCIHNFLSDETFSVSVTKNMQHFLSSHSGKCRIEKIEQNLYRERGALIELLGDVYCAKFSPDEKYIATVDFNEILQKCTLCTLCIWKNAEEPTLSHTIILCKDHLDGEFPISRLYKSLDWSPDSNFILFNGLRGAKLINAQTGSDTLIRDSLIIETYQHYTKSASPFINNSYALHLVGYAISRINEHGGYIEVYRTPQDELYELTIAELKLIEKLLVSNKGLPKEEQEQIANLPECWQKVLKMQGHRPEGYSKPS